MEGEPRRAAIIKQQNDTTKMCDKQRKAIVNKVFTISDQINGTKDRYIKCASITNVQTKYSHFGQRLSRTKPTQTGIHC